MRRLSGSPSGFLIRLTTVTLIVVTLAGVLPHGTAGASSSTVLFSASRDSGEGAGKGEEAKTKENPIRDLEPEKAAKLELDLQKELQKLSSERAPANQAPDLNILAAQLFNYRWQIPFTDYLLMLRGEEGLIRCVGKRAWHINVHLRNLKTQTNVFNFHVGAARHGSTGKITVFLFDSVRRNLEFCRQVPTVNDVKQTIQDLLQQFLQFMGVTWPVWLVGAVATVLAWAIFTIGIPVLI